ncbi:kinase-like domain-containing protein [Xylariaceae sp. FL1272]|nr:kinase-like domain-containing protein [Xylariaceae sp. FL1272]
MAPRRAADVVANDVIKFFKPDPRFTFEKKAGAGAWGKTLCFKVNHPQPGVRYGRFIVKVITSRLPTGPRANADQEIAYLKRLQWAKHILQIFNITPDPLAVPGFDRPYFFTEYLDNGTLHRFIQKFAAAYPNERLPNRFLWHIFLCLTRAAVAMAYPPGQRENTAPMNAAQRVLETTPVARNAPDPERLMHNDMKNDNIMFGENEMSFLDVLAEGPAAATEHVPIPILKLIDFGVAIEELPEERRAVPLGYAIDSYDGVLGLATIALEEEANVNIDTSPANEAVNKNIIDIGAVMGRCLFLNNYFNPVRRYEVAQLLNNQRDANTRDPTLDLDLVTLIARCLTLNERNRPRLSRLLALCRDAAHSRTQAFYGGDERESDGFIADLVQRLIFDARDN